MGDDDYIAISSRQHHTIYLIDKISGQVEHSYTDRKLAPSRLCATDNNELVVVDYQKNSNNTIDLAILSLLNGKLQDTGRRIDTKLNMVFSVDFMRDNHVPMLVICAGPDHGIRAINLATGALRWEITGIIIMPLL